MFVTKQLIGAINFHSMKNKIKVNEAFEFNRRKKLILEIKRK